MPLKISIFNSRIERFFCLSKDPLTALRSISFKSSYLVEFFHYLDFITLIKESVMRESIKNTSLFYQLLAESGEEKALNWIQTQAEKIETTSDPNTLFLGFSQASRYFKKGDFSPSEKLVAILRSEYANLEVGYWTLLQVARTYLMMSLELEKEQWFKAINQLFETGDLYEQQALFAALPVLPFHNELIPRAIDGLRTNISVVFDAIALNNPFPSQYFPEGNWNQMVLKAIFMQRPLYRIQNLNKRRNLALADIARDFAHERWAAGRDVMPELWRLIAPFVNEYFQKDLEKVFATEDTLQMRAAALAIHESDFAPAKMHLEKYPELIQSIQNGEINWESIGSEFQRTCV